MNEQERLTRSARLTERAATFREQVEESVLPLFIKDERQRPSRCGSCVLFSLGENHFILSASHVIRPIAQQRIYAGLAGQFAEVLGQTRFFTTDNVADPFDLALVALPTSSMSEFSGGVFLSLDDTDRTDQANYENLHESQYLVFGFSESKSQVRVDGQTRQILQRGLTITVPPAPLSAYSAPFDRSAHLLLDYDQEDVMMV